ncbi:NADH:flavin oxidoreductase/NADH oxidase [Solidesulfovibrio fructosivorans JJ]]|uniref:NADH:flavin oxidoreductase/NADH oxidase n=1 Tax=Solidesulfovibrio fructosivorans JJ] TaxID=596151 RepID=E1JVR5_SOLFR|nr:NADH:flavin oxidoreductase/NADH oxidase [Solidesulfovibrio fructosivorans]EFL51553.1 NADH:flavin oxidoreductase/NADH oxidase [Solidesulfovibrio fructosivorans JJ]]
MSVLFSPVKIGPRTLKNRIIIAPMCQYSAENGHPTYWHAMHLGHLAISGAGALIIEATAVEPQGRISAQDLGLWSKAHEDSLRRTLTAVRACASIPILVQLAHAGRKASTANPWEGGAQIPPDHGGWAPEAPSAIPYEPEEIPPHALDAAGLDRIEQAFVDAAKRADALDLAGVEIHCAHGYLLHQFLSPLSNTRDDDCGGSLENRMCFPLRIVKAVRKALPRNRILGIRISATDWVPGGWDIEDSVAFAREIKKLGCDYIHVSSGGLSPKQQIPLAPGYQAPFAERIRRETGLPTIAVGLITDPALAETIVVTGQADMVALARGMLYDPRWPWHAAAALGDKVDAPDQYLRCEPHGLKGLFRR